MSAQPAEKDYAQSQPPRSLFQPPAQVIDITKKRSGAPQAPEQNQDQNDQTRTTNSGLNSGTRITLGDIPGDWESVVAVWTETPDPLCDMVDQALQARIGGTPAEIALACWAVLVVVPRAACHLLSWLLSHPLRLAAAVVLTAVFLATL